jgi:hypothetical protein
MISDNFRFRQFAEIAAGKEIHQIIYLAEQEALQAWRQAHPSKGLSSSDRERSLDYQQKLLGLIAYLRHGIVPTDCDKSHAELFRSIRQATAADSLMAS